MYWRFQSVPQHHQHQPWPKSPPKTYSWIIKVILLYIYFLAPFFVFWNCHHPEKIITITINVLFLTIIILLRHTPWSIIITITNFITIIVEISAPTLFLINYHILHQIYNQHHNLPHHILSASLPRQIRQPAVTSPIAARENRVHLGGESSI